MKFISSLVSASLVLASGFAYGADELKSIKESQPYRLTDNSIAVINQQLEPVLNTKMHVKVKLHNTTKTPEQLENLKKHLGIEGANLTEDGFISYEDSLTVAEILDLSRRWNVYKIHIVK